MPQAVTTPVQDRSRKKRREILAKALLVFSETGFASASLREIARRADVPHATLTYYFGSKDRLWREAVTFMFERLEEEMSPDRMPDSEVDPSARFRRDVERYVLYSARHPEHARITIWETLQGSERLSWLVDTFVRSSHDRTRKLFIELNCAGLLREMDFEQFVYLFVGSVQMPFLIAAEAQLALGVDAFSEDQIKKHVDALCQLFLAENR